MTKLYEVNDGNRKLVFRGELLAQSTSRQNGKGRWIEFSLYSTESGGYVLSRVGQSRVVHSETCGLARKNGLDMYGLDEVGSLDGLYTCEQCHIDLQNDEYFCPETPRFWAMKLFTAEDVVQALHKRDRSGNIYLTNVSRDLLEDAADLDEDIADAYYTDRF